MYIWNFEKAEMQKPHEIFMGFKSLNSIKKLIEFFYKKSQTGFISVSISFVEQSSGNCIIDNTGNFAVSGNGCLFIGFSSEIADSCSELGAVASVAVSLYYRSLNSLFTRFVVWHKCILSIYNFVNNFNTTFKYNRQNCFVNC